MSREEHHEKLSSLGFYFEAEDLPIINDYQGDWMVTGDHKPDNYWVVTTDGKGHPITGHPSPQEALDWARNNGWLPAYVAPYGTYVEGALDGVQLHDWIANGRHERKHSHRFH
ncbi:hypothetical protein AAC03nite_21750 [Alicyclobacillus acidoterrestris]|uniref:hypothetical protein n=1 Tax=Alicyclobacillus suci TaxID=2816080 RepID=UPI0011934CD4|nr:hypothetical protein [Alicyclobacillus suci]GEO26390.1 hypothetical protein AAC03nite_21750 [Alicyclobacillus acidoterrestris]